MAVIKTDKKWLYLMEPHTASRAVNQVLCDELKASEFGHHHISVSDMSKSRRAFPIKDLDNYDVICTVRNPFDVLITQWKYGGHSRENPSFIPFLDWVCKNIKHDMIKIPLKGLWKECSHFVYYESINADLSRVFNRDLKLPFHEKHVTKGKLHWSEYWQGKIGYDVLVLLMPLYDEFLTFFGYDLDWVEGPILHIDKLVHDKRCKRIRLP